MKRLGNIYLGNLMIPAPSFQLPSRPSTWLTPTYPWPVPLQKKSSHNVRFGARNKHQDLSCQIQMSSGLDKNKSCSKTPTVWDFFSVEFKTIRLLFVSELPIFLILWDSNFLHLASSCLVGSDDIAPKSQWVRAFGVFVATKKITSETVFWQQNPSRNTPQQFFLP